MANKNLKYQVSADVQGFVDGMEEAAYSTDKAEKAIADMIKESIPLQKMLKSTEREASKLAASWMMLSNTEKQTTTGQKLEGDLSSLKLQAMETANTLSDLREEIKNGSSNTLGFDAAKESLEAMGGALSSVLGTIASFTGKQEDFNRAIATMATVTNIANTALKVRNILLPFSSTMLKINRIQLAAATRAEELKTAATVKATVAQRIFNAVAKANPYVLLASAILAVGTALTTFIIASNKAQKQHKEEAEALKQEQKESEALANKWKDNAKKVNEAGGEIVAKYTLMKDEYSRLKSEHEKTQWIKDNQEKFKDLGISVTDLKTAEQVFVDYTDDVVEALETRVKAAAMYEVLVKEIAEYIANGGDIDSIFKEDKSENDAIINALKNQKDGLIDLTKAKKDFNDVTINQGDAIQPQTQFEPLPIKKETEVEHINKDLKEYIGLSQQASIATNKFSNLFNSITKNKVKIDYEKGSLDDLEAQLKTLQSNQKKGINVLSADEYKKEVDILEKKIKDKKIELGIESPKSEVEQYEEKLKKELKDAEDAYKLAVKNDNKAAQEAAEQAYKVAQEKLDKLKIKIKAEIDRESINKDIESVMKSLQPDDHYNYDFSFLPDGYAEKAEDAQNRLNKIIDARKRLNEIAEKNKDSETQARIQSELAKTDEEYQKLIKDVENFNQVSSKIKEREKDFESFTNVVSTMNDVVGSIDGVVSSIQNLTKAFDEDASGWEKFMAIWQTAMSIMQAVTTVMTIINTIQDIMNAKKAIGGAVVAKEAAAQIALTTAQGTGIGTTTGFAAAQAAALAPTLAMATALKQLAAAQIFAAHAYIPFAGPAIAAGYVGMMEGVMASIIAFAEGGIVPGGKSLHDNRLAMVSSGEMILNHRQQDNLFKAIDAGLVGGGANKVEVTGVLRGKDLLLVQKNYNTIAGNSGQKINLT